MRKTGRDGKEEMTCLVPFLKIYGRRAENPLRINPVSTLAERLLP